MRTVKSITKTGKPSIIKKNASTIVPPDASLLNPDYFINRELSWLDFNDRVLEEARDSENPLLERMKFLAITCSNLDEFFMIRVASLKELLHANYTEPDASGLTPRQQLKLISEKTHGMVDTIYSSYNRAIIPKLKKNGIHIVSDFDKLTAEQEEFCRKYFHKKIYPVITPMAADSARPFPLISNKSLNICALLMKKGSRKIKYRFITVQVPGVLPRFIELPSRENGQTYILLENIMKQYMGELFNGYSIISSASYRIMRNADLPIDEEDAQDLLKKIQKSLKKRRWGEVMRLEVEKGIDHRLLGILQEELAVGNDDVYQIQGPLDLTMLMKLYDMLDLPALKYSPFSPLHPDNEWETDIFSVIRRKDMLLHHPYDSFDPVVELIRQAAEDPQVLAIKQTLYRVSGNSPIIRNLAKAAENGKQVMVLVEVKARFDEEKNINWALELDKAGCHVIYGVVGLKTHSKITMVVRQEGDEIRRYVHLGTGNYNDSTAKIYTDLSLFTCSKEIGDDATETFNMLSGYSQPPEWNRLVLAPLWLRDKMTQLIRQEAAHARAGEEAALIFKMNSLVDPLIIAELYEASRAGVKIQLIVRGICCLKAGIKGLSETIQVRSLIGRFLEHSRIYWFRNGGDEKFFLSSADLMPRNLDRRVEIMFPIEDEEIQEKIRELLQLQLTDTQRARVMDTAQVYHKVDKRGKNRLDSQKEFCERAEMKNREIEERDAIHTTQIFTPIVQIHPENMEIADPSGNPVPQTEGENEV